jgi:hypothetical protein
MMGALAPFSYLVLTYYDRQMMIVKMMPVLLIFSKSINDDSRGITDASRSVIVDCK